MSATESRTVSVQWLLWEPTQPGQRKLGTFVVRTWSPGEILKPSPPNLSNANDSPHFSTTISWNTKAAAPELYVPSVCNVSRPVFSLTLTEMPFIVQSGVSAVPSELPLPPPWLPVAGDQIQQLSAPHASTVTSKHG